MLNIYLNSDAKKPNIDYIDDVEAEFTKIKLDKDSNDMIKILKDIENAKIYDSTSFIDRFNKKLRSSDLSTGCKAALCILKNPNKLVNTRGCGLNAISTIIQIIEDGYILMVDPQIYIPYTGKNPSINAVLDGYRFDNLDRLSSYICDERPFKPEMSGGIYNV